MSAAGMNVLSTRLSAHALLIAALVTLPTALPESQATAGPWLLLDPEADVGSPTNFAVAVAKDGADIRSLSLHRAPDAAVEVAIRLTSLDHPYPELPGQAHRQVWHVLRFTAAEWDVIVDITVTSNGVTPAYVFIMNDQEALWWEESARLTPSGIELQLRGAPFDEEWSGISMESVAEVCARACLAAPYRDRAPDVGTAPAFG